VLSLVLQLEAHMVAAVAAWREGLSIDARYFVRIAVNYIVRHGVDARSFALLSGLKNISNGWCHEGTPCPNSHNMEESLCAGCSSMSGSGG
jgi:hypothetical protein